MLRRINGEILGPAVKANKLRVIQLGSYPQPNRGARTNLLTIHERLLAGGHESVVIDLTRNRREKIPHVYSPRTAIEVGRLLLDTPADIVHLHIGGEITARKLVLAAFLRAVPDLKTVCSLHLGGRFYPKRGLRGRRWGPAALILRQFDALIGINPEIISFFKRIGAAAKRVHMITPFPRLRVAEGLTLSESIEEFCQQHTPLIVSVGALERGYDLPMQFEILSRVRARYPSAGLLAIGGGSQGFKFRYQRALHQDANHIEITGDISQPAAIELVKRASVFLRTSPEDGDPFSIREALQAGIPIVATNNGRRPTGTHLAPVGDVNALAERILKAVQTPRLSEEPESPEALSDGVDDVIRLYWKIAKTKSVKPAAGLYEWPSMRWGL